MNVPIECVGFERVKELKYYEEALYDQLTGGAVHLDKDGQVIKYVLVSLAGAEELIAEDKVAGVLQQLARFADAQAMSEVGGIASMVFSPGLTVEPRTSAQASQALKEAKSLGFVPPSPNYEQECVRLVAKLTLISRMYKGHAFQRQAAALLMCFYGPPQLELDPERLRLWEESDPGRSGETYRFIHREHMLWGKTVMWQLPDDKLGTRVVMIRCPTGPSAFMRSFILSRKVRKPWDQADLDVLTRLGGLVERTEEVTWYRIEDFNMHARLALAINCARTGAVPEWFHEEYSAICSMLIFMKESWRDDVYDEVRNLMGGNCLLGALACWPKFYRLQVPVSGFVYEEFASMACLLKCPIGSAIAMGIGLPPKAKMWRAFPQLIRGEFLTKGDDNSVWCAATGRDGGLSIVYLPGEDNDFAASLLSSPAHGRRLIEIPDCVLPMCRLQPTWQVIFTKPKSVRDWSLGDWIAAGLPGYLITFFTTSGGVDSECRAVVGYVD